MMEHEQSERDVAIRRRVAQNTISNYATKIVALAIWFLLTPFILRYLGAAQYGIWVLGVSVVAYGALLDLGVSSAIVKFVSEHRARGDIAAARGLVATSLTFFTLVGAGIFALALAFAPFFPALFGVAPDQAPTASWVIVLLGVNAALAIPFTAAHGVLQGHQRYDLANINSAGNVILGAVATVIALRAGFGLVGMLVGNIAVASVMQAVTIGLVYRIAPELHFGYGGASLGQLRTIVGFSGALFVGNIAAQIETKTDEIVIGVALAVAAVTPYALARKLSEVPRLLTEQLVKVFLPLASELHAAGDRARLRALYLEGTRLVLALYLPLGLTIVLLASPLLTRWVGSQYAGEMWLVLVLTLAGLLDLSQWPAGAVLQGMARHRPLAAIAIGAASANLVLSLLLVQRFGALGVALGTLIPTTVTSLGFTAPYAMRVIGVGAWQVLRHAVLPTILPTLPTGVVVYGLRRLVEPTSLIALASVAGAGLLTYAVGYWCVGASATERKIYGNLVRSVFHAARRRLGWTEAG